MAGTFHQIYIQVVFAVKGRENLISSGWKDELHKYMSGIITGKEQKSISKWHARPYSCFYWIEPIYETFRPGARYEKQFF